MGYKKLIMKNYIFYIFVLITGACKSQVPVIWPKTVIPTTTDQIPIWNGTSIVLKQLSGFTINSTTISTPSVVDNSVTNEGQLSIAGNTSVSGVTLTSNTSGSTTVKIAGKDGTYIHKSATNDTLIIGNNNTRNILTNHSAVTVSTTTLTDVGGTLIEQEDGLNEAFVIYIHYTTGATTQGLQFRLISANPSRGTYWYDYNFPITGGRQTGAIYNASTTITIPSSESGTNIGIIRGVSKSNAVGLGIFDLRLQISAEDRSSTITTLTTGVTQF